MGTKITKLFLSKTVFIKFIKEDIEDILTKESICVLIVFDLSFYSLEELAIILDIIDTGIIPGTAHITDVASHLID
jgi:hypothetical protein